MSSAVVGHVHPGRHHPSTLVGPDGSGCIASWPMRPDVPMSPAFRLAHMLLAPIARYGGSCRGVGHGVPRCCARLPGDGTCGRRSTRCALARTRIRSCTVSGPKICAGGSVCRGRHEGWQAEPPPGNVGGRSGGGVGAGMARRSSGHFGTHRCCRQWSCPVKAPPWVRVFRCMPRVLDYSQKWSSQRAVAFRPERVSNPLRGRDEDGRPPRGYPAGGQARGESNKNTPIEIR